MGSARQAEWVTACIPYHRCEPYVARAVESLLNQSYPWVRIIVINDGDMVTPPWTALAHIDDPRLFRFDLLENRGPYFCLELARRATPDPYFLIQDADDWSTPERVETLLATLHESGADFAISSIPQFYEGADGKIYHSDILWDGSNPAEQQRAVDTHLTPHYRYRSPHHGLFRSAVLRDIGGYYGGFRVNWDVIVTNLVLMTGTISWTPVPLYHRFLRPDSLSHAPKTGIHSRYAEKVREKVRRLYCDCHHEYLAFANASRDRATFLDRLQRIASRNVTAREWIALAASSWSLQAAMSR